MKKHETSDKPSMLHKIAAAWSLSQVQNFKKNSQKQIFLQFLWSWDLLPHKDYSKFYRQFPSLPTCLKILWKAVFLSRKVNSSPDLANAELWKKKEASCLLGLCKAVINNKPAYW